MKEVKTKSIRSLDERIGRLDKEEDSVRCEVLKGAKNFKTSWITLGQALYTVWKDKLYRDWGYQKFDTYTAKEIGIRKETALKLLRSYYFLEKEEPLYLNNEHNQKVHTASVPTFESVDALRLANKKKELDRADYERIKEKVLKNGIDAREVKKDLVALIREREELEPQEAWKKKRLTLLKRFVSALRSIGKEIRISKALPDQIEKEIEKLINKIEAEM